MVASTNYEAKLYDNSMIRSAKGFFAFNSLLISESTINNFTKEYQGERLWQP
jgi:hypothetical protein